MQLVLDIETVGSDDPEVISELAASITPPGNITKPETIKSWMDEKHPALLADAVKRTAFDGGLGKVICVGYAIDEQYPMSIISAADKETEILEFLAKEIKGMPTVIGHNVGWDIRFLIQRYWVNRIPPPAFLRAAAKAKPWELFDTMLMWNPDRDRRISLDKLCRTLGVRSSKSEMDGSMVWDAYKAGKINQIAKYCIEDVTATRECFWRMAR